MQPEATCPALSSCHTGQIGAIGEPRESRLREAIEVTAEDIKQEQHISAVTRSPPDPWWCRQFRCVGAEDSSV